MIVEKINPSVFKSYNCRQILALECSNCATVVKIMLRANMRNPETIGEPKGFRFRVLNNLMIINGSTEIHNI